MRSTATVVCTGLDPDLERPTLNGILRVTCDIWAGNIENYD